MEIQMPVNLTIDGVDHPVSAFSEQVQRLVFIHTSWRNDLQKERLAVMKSEAAVRALDAELAQLVASELSAKKTDEASAEDTPAEE